MQLISRMKASLLKIVAGTALACCVTSPVFALDSQALVSRFQHMMRFYDLDMKHAGVKADGDTVTLQGVTLMLTDEDANAQTPLVIGDILLNHVREAADGSYLIGQMAIGKIDIAYGMGDDGDSGHFVIERTEAADLYLPPKGSDYSLSQHLPYKQLAFRNVSMAAHAKNVVTIDEIHCDFNQPKPNDVITTTFSIDGFYFDPAAMPGINGEQIQKTLADLGYDKVEGGLHGSDVWNPYKDGSRISNYEMIMKDGGKLATTLNLNGLTENTLREFQGLYGRMMSSNKDNGLEALALLGVVHHISINAMTLRYDDLSLVNRYLDTNSKALNMPRAEMVKQMKDALPLLRDELPDPQLAEKAISALGAFLDNPKSLEISLSPKKPVSVGLLVTTAATMPQKLFEMLGIDIKANQ